MLCSLLVLPLVNTSQASSGTAQSGYTFKQTITFNPYGQFQVNETIRENPNSTLPVSYLTLGLPAKYSGHIADVTASISAGSTTKPQGILETIGSQSVDMTMNFQPALSPGQNASVNLSFYVIGVYKPFNSTVYLVPTVLLPSLSIRVDSTTSNLVLPYSDLAVANSTIQIPAPGFSQTVTSTTQLWSYVSNTPSTPSLTTGTLMLRAISSSSTGDLIFQNLTRVISVSASGQPNVIDTMKIINLGANQITSLNYALLLNGSTTPAPSVTVVPPTDPLLSNEHTAQIWSGGQLALTSSAVNNPVSPNSSYALTVDYPLDHSYWNITNGVYHVNIPGNLPVNALVNYYKLTVQIPTGIVVTQSSGTIQAFNVSAPQPNVILSYRQGIGSALGDWVPVAAIGFIAVFIAGIVFRPRRETIAELESGVEDLVKAAEEKVSGTNEILSELKAKGASASRNDLISSRARIDEVRIKFANRLGALRSRIGTTTPGVQSDLSTVTANDREYDRAIRDSLNTFDQFISRRMKPEAFERLRTNNERRVQKAANDLLDSVQAARRTYEA